MSDEAGITRKVEDVVNGLHEEIDTLKAKVAELQKERDGYKNILEAINCTLQPMAKLVRDAIGMPGQKGGK